MVVVAQGSSSLRRRYRQDHAKESCIGRRDDEAGVARNTLPLENFLRSNYVSLYGYTRLVSDMEDRPKLLETLYHLLHALLHLLEHLGAIDAAVLAVLAEDLLRSLRIGSRLRVLRLHRSYLSL